MSWALAFEQLLNGLQYGVMLFLMAAGLTLVFGIMNLVNLAHGSLYMVGAYLAAAATQWTGNYLLGVVLGLAGTLVVGMVVEVTALRTLYERDHLDQVLATFGLILFFNELIAIVWGRAPLYSSLPPWLQGHIKLFAGSTYPVYRAAVIVVGLLVAALLWYVVTRTRLGMLIRAGASNRTLVGAIIVGVVDTLGRAFLKPLLGTMIPPTAAEAAGPALASMLIYLLMAVVLAVKPAGLFANR